MKRKIVWSLGHSNYAQYIGRLALGNDFYSEIDYLHNYQENITHVTKTIFAAKIMLGIEYEKRVFSKLHFTDGVLQTHVLDLSNSQLLVQNIKEYMSNTVKGL